MEEALRPHGLGATQYYVLHHLATAGPTMQRDLALSLQIERATLSAIVTALVGKGLVGQEPDRVDQRQKILRLTAEGEGLRHELPDLGFIRDEAFADIPDADIAVAVRVLRTATERLHRRLNGDNP
ncbi:DNA-binding MarR family transcriptional regulator [Sphingomonas zeicaulis]|uniref:MarR family winged helix-turn-helix transcriptional regulator n=1 Tax=Sphingomonas zeicaulis TaxID=1632740 RepID=UPI003D23D654